LIGQRQASAGLRLGGWAGDALKAVAVAAVSILAYVSGVLQPLDDGLSQLRFQLLQRPASHTLTVVEIDARSLRAAGAWPWNRARFAKAIDNLTLAGADLVALDVDFSAPSTPGADSILQASIAARPGAVVLPTFVQQDDSRTPTRLHETRPLAALSGQAVLAGVNVPVDSDGRVRRYRYGFKSGAVERTSMGATLAGAPPGLTDAFLIDYGIMASDIDRLSFEDVYRGRFDPSLVRGRKVLIGATALELGDEFATPRRGTLPGVYVHALAYESLHGGRGLGRLQWPVLLALAAAAAAWLRPAGALSLARALRRHLLLAAALLALPVAAQAAFPVSIDISPLILAQGLCLLWTVRGELRRRARQVVEAREAHLVQMADHMRKSRNRIRAKNRQLEAANAELDKALRARTDFLAATSHEIRTPLNGVLGMAQVILADRTLSEGLREKMVVLKGSGETMLALIDDILDVAKIETGNLVISPAELDLHALLAEAAHLWGDKASEKGVAVRVVRGDAPGRIIEDGMRLRQVVFNLMSNAVKFTDQGQVELTAGVEAAAEGEALILRVSDTGVGIPADKLQEIFEAFRQADNSVSRRYGGTGLGLAISRQLTIAMGGTLTVESQPGEGSVFEVRLPLRRAAAAANDVAAAPEVPADSFERAAVLVVEANPIAQSALKAALEPHVGRLELAASCEAATSLLRSRRFDILLAEGKSVSLGGQGAGQAIASLREETAGAHLAILWAGAEDEIPGLLAHGADQVVRKPIGTVELVKVLQDAYGARLDGAGAGAARLEAAGAA
jgi:signal transduction histidine kinase/CheY-like chemotaxis protein